MIFRFPHSHTLALSLCVHLDTLQFKKLVVDQLTEKHQLPITRFGIEWMLGSSDTPLTGSFHTIELVGMKGPNNFFTIFLPKKALQEPERSRKGMHVVACVCMCVRLCVQAMPVCVCVCVCVCACVK